MMLGEELKKLIIMWGTSDHHAWWAHNYYMILGDSCSDGNFYGHKKKKFYGIRLTRCTADVLFCSGFFFPLTVIKSVTLMADHHVVHMGRGGLVCQSYCTSRSEEFHARVTRFFFSLHL